MTRTQELTIAATGWEALAKSRAGDIAIQAETIATLQATINSLCEQLLEACGEIGASGNKCPACDEAREDYLVWNCDDIVECATCGARYDPATDCQPGYGCPPDQDAQAAIWEAKTAHENR